MTRSKLLFFIPDEFTLSGETTLHICQPVDRQTVLRAEMPWESRFIAFYTTMILVENEYFLYYTCRDRTGFGALCLARSPDGVHFERPSLGIRDYCGSKNNNLLAIDSLEGCIQYDPSAKPEERFFCVAHHYKIGFLLHVSPDGVHWQTREQILLRRFCDSQNLLIKNPSGQGYWLYARGWEKNDEGRYERTVIRADWPELHAPLLLPEEGDPHICGGMPSISNKNMVVMRTDTRDARNTDVYTNSVEPYEGYYIAFPAMYRHAPDPECGGQYVNDGDLNVAFAASADGVLWHRYDRTPYIPQEIAGRYACKMAFIGPGIIKREETLNHYGTIFRTTHGANPERDLCPDGTIVRYEQRMDGFVCTLFGVNGGEMRTRPWKVKGMELSANMDCGICGTLDFALADASGRVLPGFDYADYIPAYVNRVHQPLRWRGGALPTQDELIVMARGSQARLFALQFTGKGERT